ncbi:dihydrodipicolinate synthase family protein [Labrenzia sp. DG1229]|uniref:dihydrodipicolinate synthase family protein n=1 Tax=Labrenzia sp. DG1229 TaxID=681847 RepID=UPI0004917D76|nr:dihydrodipicolinate synthase family protein [Labrenzia sp. DG1229]
MTFSSSPAKAGALSEGILVSTLTPFDDAGAVLFQPITDQAKRLAQIDGVLGIAINTTERERLTLSSDERVEIIRRTRKGLSSGQLLLCCVGELSKAVTDDVLACQDAVADAIITFPAKWEQGYENQPLEQRLAVLADLTDQLPLPVIVALGNGEKRRSALRDEIIALAQYSEKVIGFDMGADDNVLHYDQDYYALKSIDRPLACLPSSEAALFHNLNTGADGVLSCLAFIAPHEVSELYQATREHRFCDAQVIHNRLSPLIGLLAGHNQQTREMIYREAAHYCGLLASTGARGLTGPLSQQLKTKIRKTLDNIGLKPVLELP